MTYPRVNLLKKSEQRYQGMVSRRFIVVSIVLAPILLISLIGGVTLVRYGRIKSELRTKQETWKVREPQLAKFNEEQGILKTNSRILSFFEQWQKSQLPLVVLMDEIQSTVPDNIQFMRMSLRSEVSEAVYDQPENMAIEPKLFIDGISQGDHAEVDVIQFRKDLLDRKDVVSVFSLIDLAGPMRRRQNSSGLIIREFSLEGKNGPGGGR